MLAVSRGLDRDRVVDETGNQTVVFGRRGARPLHPSEMKPFIRHADGDIFRVEDVKVKDGKLLTKAGAELATPLGPPAMPAPKPPTGIPLLPEFMPGIEVPLLPSTQPSGTPLEPAPPTTPLKPELPPEKSTPPPQ